jgi:hypothetical protein
MAIFAKIEVSPKYLKFVILSESEGPCFPACMSTKKGAPSFRVLFAKVWGQKSSESRNYHIN